MKSSICRFGTAEDLLASSGFGGGGAFTTGLELPPPSEGSPFRLFRNGGRPITFFGGGGGSSMRRPYFSNTSSWLSGLAHTTPLFVLTGSRPAFRFSSSEE